MQLPACEIAQPFNFITDTLQSDSSTGSFDGGSSTCLQLSLLQPKSSHSFHRFVLDYSTVAHCLYTVIFVLDHTVVAHCPYTVINFPHDGTKITLYQRNSHKMMDRMDMYFMSKNGNMRFILYASCISSAFL